MLALVIALLLQAPAAAPAAPPPVISNPEWTSQPSEEDIDQVYPGAGGLISAGYVTLACKVTADGGLAPCEVVSEAPGYVGFGSAALKLTGKYKMKPTAEGGRYPTGAVVMLAIQFPRRGS